MKVRIKAVTELLAPRPMWQDHPGAIPRPMPGAPLVAPRYLIEVESLDDVNPEELARLEVGTADWAELVFPNRRQAEFRCPACNGTGEVAVGPIDAATCGFCGGSGR